MKNRARQRNFSARALGFFLARLTFTFSPVLYPLSNVSLLLTRHIFAVFYTLGNFLTRSIVALSQLYSIFSKYLGKKYVAAQAEAEIHAHGHF